MVPVRKTDQSIIGDYTALSQLMSITLYIHIQNPAYEYSIYDDLILDLAYIYVSINQFPCESW